MVSDHGLIGKMSILIFLALAFSPISSSLHLSFDAHIFPGGRYQLLPSSFLSSSRSVKTHSENTPLAFTGSNGLSSDVIRLGRSHLFPSRQSTYPPISYYANHLCCSPSAHLDLSKRPSNASSLTMKVYPDINPSSDSKIKVDSMTSVYSSTPYTPTTSESLTSPGFEHTENVAVQHPGHPPRYDDV